MRLGIASAATSLLLALPAAAAGAQLSRVGRFSSPIYVTAPPGDPHRLFVAEKAGAIHLLHDGVRRKFLDVSADVVGADERGLLSMAFAPDYATSGRLYVYYTAPRPGDPDGSVLTLAEFRRSPVDPDRADPASRRIVLELDHPANFNHNGGQVQFGPDGLLYLAPGDGGGTNDPLGHAQDRGVPLGKLLRIDPRQNGTAPYSVPADNPFVGDPGADPRIYAYGLRNPWRFSFDRLSGDLAIGDVGQDTREEVDFSPRGTAAGADYGWRCMEGRIPTPGVTPCTPSGTYVGPVFDYPHTGGRCAIAGGYVVRNHDLDSLYGRYVYTDYCRRDIRSMFLSYTVADDRSTGLALPRVQSFGEDSCGHLYVASAHGEVNVLVDGAFTPCPGAAGPPFEDLTPPRLQLARRYRQRLRRHRSLYLTVRCDERCGVTTSAALSVPGAARVFKVASVSRSLRAGRRTELRLLLPRRAARAARQALRRGRGVRATLKVVARDSAGNQTVKRRPVRVLP